MESVSSPSGVWGMVVRGTEWLLGWTEQLTLGTEMSGRAGSSGGVSKAAGCGIGAAMPNARNEGRRRSWMAFLRRGDGVTSVLSDCPVGARGGEVKAGESWHKIPCCLLADIRELGTAESE